MYGEVTKERTEEKNSFRVYLILMRRRFPSTQAHVPGVTCVCVSAFGFSFFCNKSEWGNRKLFSFALRWISFYCLRALMSHALYPKKAAPRLDIETIRTQHPFRNIHKISLSLESSSYCSATAILLALSFFLYNIAVNLSVFLS